MKPLKNFNKANLLKVWRHSATQRSFIVTMRVLVIFAFFLIWEILANNDVIDAFLFSSPSRIWETIIFLFQTHSLWHHIWVTTREVLIGFTLATILGVIIAIAIYWSNYLTKILEPIIAVLNSIPRIAYVPLFIVWFGGGERSTVAIVVAACMFITILGTLNALMQVDKQKVKLMQSFGASKWQVLTKLSIPSNLPNFFGIVNINLGIAWAGAIYGELFSSTAGLGYLIVLGQNVFNYSIIMSSIIVICVVSSLMFVILGIIRRLVLRNKYTK